jgi:hypothetical protein
VITAESSKDDMQPSRFEKRKTTWLLKLRAIRPPATAAIWKCSIWAMATTQRANRLRNRRHPLRRQKHGPAFVSSVGDGAAPGHGLERVRDPNNKKVMGQVVPLP